LLSWGCHDKGPHTGWLKAMEIHSLTILELKSSVRGQHGSSFLQDPGQNPTFPPPRFWGWLTWSCIIPISVSIVFWPCPWVSLLFLAIFLYRHHLYWIMACVTPKWPHCNQVHLPSSTTLVPRKVTFQSTLYFRGYNPTNNSLL
jgi:hypothetical protein